jgi:hypothetical protein
MLYENGNFLEAADSAADFVERRDPEAVEIRESRATAAAESQAKLVNTFGLDVTRWGKARCVSPSGRGDAGVGELARERVEALLDEIRPGLWTWAAPHPEWHEQSLVRSYAVEREGVLLLIDPISPPEALIQGRELRVALTCPWHARSAPELGVAEAVVEARPGFYPDERVLWLVEHGALVFGDSLPGGPIPDDWLPDGRTRADYNAWLAPLLELSVELVLPTHGDPGGRDVLERALAE